MEENEDKNTAKVSKSTVQWLVMPIMLRGGKRWGKMVPFSMLSEKQAKKKHSQTLKRLAERGGLSPSEAIAIMDGGDWCPVSDKIGLEILNHMLYNTPEA